MMTILNELLLHYNLHKLNEIYASIVSIIPNFLAKHTEIISESTIANLLVEHIGYTINEDSLLVICISLIHMIEAKIKVSLQIEQLE